MSRTGPRGVDDALQTTATIVGRLLYRSRWSLFAWVSLAIGVQANAAEDPTSFQREATFDVGFFDAGLARLKENRLGHFYVHFRVLYEGANTQGFGDSHASSLRSVLGFGSRSWKGLSLHVEGENVLSFDGDDFFDDRSRSPDRAVVGDPDTTELNQLYVNYENLDLGVELRVGRQRISLDDERFIGAIAFRQNHQTFDAVRGKIKLPRDIEFEVAYIDEVHRIFGDRGPRAFRDFSSDSYLMRLAYQGLPGIQLVAFAYLLDFSSAPELSTATFGFRMQGDVPVWGPWGLQGQFSFARQLDYANNPRDITADYLWASLAAIHDEGHRLGFGFERLGSDAGRNGFTTPLATAHAFSGLADVFLDNGGAEGLRDLFASVEVVLPWRVRSKFVAHWFRQDHGSRVLGSEIDFTLARGLGRFVELRLTAAYFDPASARTRTRRVIRGFVELAAEF